MTTKYQYIVSALAMWLLLWGIHSLVGKLWAALLTGVCSFGVMYIAEEWQTKNRAPLCGALTSVIITLLWR